ncbi:MAG: exodeoxyribonuclease VII large subunit [Geobacter sp.]|nr:exodeoxyribonuclease VII large subunit [Geobacter sp.]
MNLFPEKRILTVSQLTALVRGVLEENFEHVWVEGEISNLATPTSGHLYFTLKDSGATIRCVMFKGMAKALKFRLQDGMRIVLRGRLTVYDQRGEYQILGEYLEPQGFGALQLAFQQLKERLAKEGLFADKRKRPIPLLPKTVGIITSPTGAAIHDILNVMGRRHAELHIVIYPVRVQGDGAAAEIAAAIKDMNSLGEADVLIVGRGGGSLEDLWSFNEEVVARAIAASKIPVISAVGHEVDVSIADLAADLRAPTPSAAAELVVSSKAQLAADCSALTQRLQLALNRTMDRAWSRLDIAKLSLKNPEILIERFMQRVDDLQSSAEAALAELLATAGQAVADNKSALLNCSPQQRIAAASEHQSNLALRSQAAMLLRLEAAGKALAVNSGRLEALSPLSILSRGYAVARKYPEGTTVRHVEQLVKGEAIELILADGSAHCSVNIISSGKPYGLDS